LFPFGALPFFHGADGLAGGAAIQPFVEHDVTHTDGIRRDDVHTQ